jgi:tRNA C32,U32 (ribose-2'-O)-methylase TrmJ
MKTIEPAAGALIELLERVGYTRGAAADKVTVTATTALQNAQLRVKEVEALRGMVRRLQWALDNPDLDWQRSARENRRSD